MMGPGFIVLLFWGGKVNLKQSNSNCKPIHYVQQNSAFPDFLLGATVQNK